MVRGVTMVTQKDRRNQSLSEGDRGEITWRDISHGTEASLDKMSHKGISTGGSSIFFTNVTC